MHIHVVVVGKTADIELSHGMERYLERVRRYVAADVHVVRAERIRRNVPDRCVREREGERILSLVGGRGRLLVWDARGRELDSTAFAHFLQRFRDGGLRDLWMVVGGPLGVSMELLAQADTILALSKMTFPHDLARLMVLEQLYRAFSILNGEAYHK
jgi:23S rRNA (pseudouridine1915-N3)-methyltransferase